MLHDCSCIWNSLKRLRKDAPPLSSKKTCSVKTLLNYRPSKLEIYKKNAATQTNVHSMQAAQVQVPDNGIILKV